MTHTNIKNLPEGDYITRLGWSDREAYRIVGRSASGQTLTVEAVKVENDPEWLDKMESYPGGFARHVANQSEQTWLYAGLSGNRKKVRAGTKKYGKNWTKEGVARHFYDYNF